VLTPTIAMNWVLIAAAVEVISGLVLIIRPSLFIWLLLAADLTAPGKILGRLAGLALLALAVACQPMINAGGRTESAVQALLVFSALAALYLVYVGIHGELVGVLLWPAAATHAGLAILLARDWLKGDG
jgi:hypothetical protein